MPRLQAVASQLAALWRQKSVIPQVVRKVIAQLFDNFWLNLIISALPCDTPNLKKIDQIAGVARSQAHITACKRGIRTHLTIPLPRNLYPKNMTYG